MVILKNIGMLIVIVVLGLWLFTEHVSSSLDPRQLLKGRPPPRASAVEELHQRLETLYERVSSPLFDGTTVDPIEIETWKERCRNGYENGTFNQEQATAAWRLCRMLETMNLERKRLAASADPAAGTPPIRTLDPNPDPDRARRTAESMRAQSAATWDQYVAQQRPRCERYLDALQ